MLHEDNAANDRKIALDAFWHICDLKRRGKPQFKQIAKEVKKAAEEGVDAAELLRQKLHVLASEIDSLGPDDVEPALAILADVAATILKQRPAG